MQYAKSYQLSQVGISDLLLDVARKVNEEFNLGVVGVDGFDLNVEPYSQLEGATIRYKYLEPERIKLEIFDEFHRPKALASIIESLEAEVATALVRIKSRLNNDSES